MIDGRHLENVEEFTYLGTIVTTSGDCYLEINTRISKANKAFAMLKPVWRVTNLSIRTKTKIIISSVLSVLLYGTECWKTYVAIQRTLEVFQTKCLRRILKIYWSNTISNQELRNRTGMDALVKIMQTWRWPLLGKVCRLPTNSITRTALRWTAQGKRKRGRPRETWRWA